MLAFISVGFNNVLVKDIIERQEGIENSEEYFNMIFESREIYKIYINGTLIGIIKKENVKGIYDKLKAFKKYGLFNEQVSIYLQEEDREIRVYSDTGRFVRPLFPVNEDGELKINTEVATNYSWSEMINEGYIEYLDSYEVEKSLVAMRVSDLKDRKYTHCEIHPSCMLGVCSAVIPYPEHNQSPRLVYECSMLKQALGFYALSHNKRFDTISHVLHYPQKPMVETKYNAMFKYDEMLTGSNPIVAITVYTGFSQEDSVILNKSSVDRGMFQHSCYKTVICVEAKKTSTGYEKIELPPPKIRDSSNYCYNKLNEYGIIKKGSKVTKNDVLVGKTVTKMKTMEEEESPLVASSSEEGVVDDIYVGINADGLKIVKIKIRQLRIPETGDKMASFSRETDVLTENGWKSGDTVTKEDKVATLQEGKLVYEHPINVFEYEYKGDMYHLDSQQLNMFVTANHKLYVQKRNDGRAKKHDFELIKATECFGKRLKHKKWAEWEQKDAEVMVFPKYLDFPEKIVKMKDWLYFLGIWYAEGWCSGKESCGSITLAGNKKRVQDKLFEVLKNMDINYSFNQKNKRVSILQCRQLYQHMKPLNVGAVNKTLPDYVWTVSKEEACCLLNGMLLGDGSCQKLNNSKRSKTWIYWTSSVKLADDVQRLALHCGWSANISLPEGRKAGKETEMKDGRVIYQNYDNYRVSIVTDKNEPTVNHGHVHQQNIQVEEWVPYEGKVYCLEVPGNIMYLRRNGKGYWSGNSRSSQKGVCGLMLEQQDMPFTAQGIAPDLMINAHSQPSRMTLSQLIETLSGKKCALKGEIGDATGFTSNSINPIENIAEQLKEFGFQRYGNERMYCGYTGEMLDSEIFIGPTYYQRLKHLVHDKMHCLDVYTEILTDSGWKLCKDIDQSKDKVATLVDGKNLVYELPLNHFSYYYDGELYCWESSLVDMAVTPEHKLYVKMNNSDNFELIKASNVIDRRGKCKNDAELSQINMTSIINLYEYKLQVGNDKWITRKKIMCIYDWLELTGLILANCLEYDHYSVTMDLSNHTINKKISALLKKNALIYKRGDIDNRQLINECDRSFVHWVISILRPTKFNDIVWGLTKEQSSFLLETMLYCNDERELSTKFINDGDLQRLVLHAGKSSVVVIDDDTGAKKVRVLKSSAVPKLGKFTKIQYRDKVYCVEVTSGVIYARRNGKAYWTGNSRSRGNVTMLTRQPIDGRSRDGGLRLGNHFAKKSTNYNFVLVPCEGQHDQIAGNSWKFLVPNLNRDVRAVNVNGIQYGKKPKNRDNPQPSFYVNNIEEGSETRRLWAFIFSIAA